MKKIECIIQNKKLAALEEALTHLGIRGMTVSEVKGFGNQQTRPEAFLFLPKTKVEIYTTDDEAEKIIGAIVRACQTNRPGDGKIAVFDVPDLIRIRTGERGSAAA